jgi:hypothetical protein
LPCYFLLLFFDLYFQKVDTVFPSAVLFFVADFGVLTAAVFCFCPLKSWYGFPSVSAVLDCFSFGAKEGEVHV